MTQVLMETVRESNLQNEICDGQPSDFRLPISDFGLGGADDGRADGAADFRLPILDFGLKAAADGVKWSGTAGATRISFRRTPARLGGSLVCTGT